jgi:hypothetical protein
MNVYGNELYSGVAMLRYFDDKFDLVKGAFGKCPSAPPRHPGHTFAVDDVRPARARLSERRTQTVVAAYTGGRVEACHRYNGRLVSPRGSWFHTYLCHPLIEACYRAYTDHRPLRLSPDAVWLTLLQGVAAHVRENAEELRHHFTRHQERLAITVRRDDFRRGSPKNPWPEVFADFAAAIGAHVGPSLELLRADFSTTGPVERAAGDAMLMSAILPYFEFRFMCICGIPAVTLDGTPEDWEQLVQLVRAWEAFGLGWWLEHLLPTLSQFAAASRGEVDREYWRRLFGITELCGREYFEGWIASLFPYLTCAPDPAGRRPVRRNGAFDQGLGTPVFREQDFAFGPGRVPFVWEYRGRCFDMEFIGGLIGVRQDADTGALSPEVGWAVRRA